MKLLLVSNFYPPHHRGGYGMLCHEVATRLAERGHQITVLTSSYGVTTNQEEPGINRQLKLESDVNYYHPRQVLRYYADKRYNYRIVKEVMSMTAPDVVVIWGMWNLSRQVAGWIESLAGSHVIYYLSDQWPAQSSAHQAYWDGPANDRMSWLFKKVFRFPVRWVLREAWQSSSLRLEHVMVCSKAIRDKLLQAGVPIEHARTVYHGIDPQPYRQARIQHSAESPSDVLRVVYVGALAPHKGVHTAIEALGHLAQNEAAVSIKLDILGSGHPQYEARLRQLVEHWGLGERVSFHRPIPRSELPAFLARFDVLVMPSVYPEPQARISQEAMASGMVLVATLTGGTKEILIDGKNGLAFDPEDDQGLAKQLLRLAQDADLCDNLVRAGWQTVTERFTIWRMIDEFETYLAEVAEQ